MVLIYDFAYGLVLHLALGIGRQDIYLDSYTL